MKRLLLLSGGIDSTALAAWQRPDLCLTINYGQRCAKAELTASEQVCLALGLKHVVIDLPSSQLGSGDLVGRSPHKMAPVPEWWPFRNQFLLTIGAMIAIERGLGELLFGAVASDRQHSDGSPAFFSALNELFACQEGALVVSVPAIEMASVTLLRIAKVPLEILAWSHSCHVSNLACGECRGCNKHTQIFSELGYF
jgi:7-cyano-7-deazaguanine synthase